LNTNQQTSTIDPKAEIMNAQVSCLVLFALLFATAWSHDSAPVTSTDGALASTVRPVPRQHAIAVLARMRRLKSVEKHPHFSQPADNTLVSVDPPDKPHVLVDGIEVPLPDGIGCGNYRVTLADGSETEIQLTECDLEHWGLQQGQSTVGAFMIDGEGEPWHFRRIEVLPVDTSTLASKTNLETPQIEARELMQWAATQGRAVVSFSQWRWKKSQKGIQRRAASMANRLVEGVTEWSQRLTGPLQRIAPRLRFSFGEPNNRRL
jgi:hypothetical protein